jgi:hypothetical protein
MIFCFIFSIETFDFLMDSRYTTESLKKYVGNIGSVLKELSLSKNSDHAYKAKKVLDSLAKRGGDMVLRVCHCLESNVAQRHHQRLSN